MRVAVIILSLFGGLVMLEQAVIPMRLVLLLSASEQSPTAVGSLVLFAPWAVATALIYAYPGVACWLFALAGGVGMDGGRRATSTCHAPEPGVAPSRCTCPAPARCTAYTRSMAWRPSLQRGVGLAPFALVLCGAGTCCVFAR